MSAALNPAGAPPFVGPTPPDRIQMTFGEHLSAALNVFASTNLSEQDMREFKVFMLAIDQVARQKLEQQGGQLVPEESSPIAPGASQDTEEYGTQPGAEPVSAGM